MWGEQVDCRALVCDSALIIDGVNHLENPPCRRERFPGGFAPHGLKDAGGPAAVAAYVRLGGAELGKSIRGAARVGEVEHCRIRRKGGG